MLSNLFVVVLPLLSLSLSSLALAADPLYTICSSSGNYSTYDPYAQNLPNLLSTLSLRVPLNGFAVALSGKAPDTAYGLGLCRGDVSSSACSTCISDAATQIRQACPTQKEAIIYFDNCLLRYSNTRFFGAVDTGVRVFMWNTAEVLHNAQDFNDKVVGLLNAASAEAYGNPKLFGTEEADIVVDGASEKLYSLAQCTRDISAAQCKSCLESIVGDFPNCCSAKKGGRVLAASCNFRYELYPFYSA